MLLPSCQWHSFFGSSPSGAGLLRSCTCTWCWIRSSLGSFLSKCPTKTLSYRQILFASSSSFCLFIDKQGITTSIRDVTCFGQTWVLLVRTCMARHRRTHTSRWLLHQCSVSMCRTWGLACLVISTSANCLLMYHLDVQVQVETSTSRTEGAKGHWYKEKPSWCLHANCTTRSLLLRSDVLTALFLSFSPPSPPPRRFCEKKWIFLFCYFVCVCGIRLGERGA